MARDALRKSTGVAVPSGWGGEHARAFRIVLLLVLALALGGFTAEARAAPGDIGYEGPSSAGSGSAPTGSKPESKLWWNDGFWWASMWDTASADFHIFKLNTGPQTWSDTEVALDDRAKTRADVLWHAASGKLYVASHRFSESPATGYPSRLYRYSYNASTDTYTRDSGFPATINNFRTETLVIDRDSSGQLWATWVQGGKIWVNASVCNPACNDASWGTAFSLNPANVSSDDISSLIAFGGNKIGVMWSNQSTSTDYFAVHSDSAADNVWTIENALQGAGLADDHINLKTDSSGRVFAAVKTSKSGSTDPLIMLLVRAAGGGWSNHVFALKRDHHTRPIVLLDEANSLIRVFATAPESGGTIYQKTSPMSSISFAGGLGTPFIKDADGSANNATSTKQNLSSATGLVVMAHSNVTYFHNFDSLGGGGGGQPPVANFTAQPSSGEAPLTVQFTDTSTGTVASREWDFQDDGIVDSNAPAPTFQYTSPNTYTARLTVSNPDGSSTTTRTITVSPPGGGGSTLTFTPTDDAYVRQPHPDENAGSDTTLRVYKTSTSDTHSYLKFTVGGVTGPVTTVTLRLWVTDASSVAGSIYAVPPAPTWAEGTITWATKPAPGAFITTGGAAPLGTWVDFDLTGAVSGDGTYSFVLKDGSSNYAWYSSKEGANDPQLVVNFG